jgi:hypothetical protein
MVSGGREGELRMLLFAVVCFVIRFRQFPYDDALEESYLLCELPSVFLMIIPLMIAKKT